MFTLNKAVAIGIILLATFLNCPVSMAQPTIPPALFMDTGNTQLKINKPSKEVLRSRYVRINKSIFFDATGKQKNLVGTEMTLNPFSNVNFVGRITMKMDSSWMGELKGIPGSSFDITIIEGRISIDIHTATFNYFITDNGHGNFRVIEVNPIEAEHMSEDGGALKQLAPYGRIGEARVLSAKDSGAVIDVLVVYTPQALAGHIAAKGGAEVGFKDTINKAINRVNTAYVNSGINTKLRLVHTEKMISYTETNDLQNDINGLLAPANSIHNLRAKYGADMIALVRETQGTLINGKPFPACGLASGVMATADKAFAVATRFCMVNTDTLGHELGHLQGANHDIYVNQRTSPVTIPYKPYSQGYVYIGTTAAASLRTMMAYDNECQFYFGKGVTCKRPLIFSNPTKNFPQTTIATGKVGVSENYKVLNATAVTVANFTQSVIAPDLNSLFSGSSLGWTPVQGLWGIDSTATSYYTSGVLGKVASSQYAGIYGDLTFEAKMYRTGCASCVNSLIIGGKYPNPSLDATTYYWQPSYVFKYTNDGQYSVAKIGSTPPLQDWKTNTTLIHSTTWNTLKVVAVGSILQFYINSTQVYSGSDASYIPGSIGIGMYKRSTDTTGNNLFVDYVTLNTTPAAARFN